MRPVVATSLKMYLGHREARDWFARVAELVVPLDAVQHGLVDVIVLPTYLQIPAAIQAFAGTPVRIGAQDVATADRGAFTGEVSAAELAEVGASVAEIGHAERRRLFGDTEEVIAAKADAALRNGLTPLLCVGERSHLLACEAVPQLVHQLERVLAEAPRGPVIVAYEPVWAIGASEPAPAEHVRIVTRALIERLGELAGREGSRVIYGGTAGPGLLTQLVPDIDGLFLGRRAHDPAVLRDVVEEAAALAVAPPARS